MSQWPSFRHLFSNLPSSNKCVYSFTSEMLPGPVQAVVPWPSGTSAEGKDARLSRDSSEGSAVEVGRKQRDTDVLPVP